MTQIQIKVQAHRTLLTGLPCRYSQVETRRSTATVEPKTEANQSCCAKRRTVVGELRMLFWLDLSPSISQHKFCQISLWKRQVSSAIQGQPASKSSSRASFLQQNRLGAWGLSSNGGSVSLLTQAKCCVQVLEQRHLAAWFLFSVVDDVNTWSPALSKTMR